MARPKTTSSDVKTVCFHLSYASWLRLQEIAQSLGLSRSKLIEIIANQDFSIREWKALIHEEKL
ncbi:MAG: hypothetical protein ACKPKQ_22925 [Dolichospermum sp.]